MRILARFPLNLRLDSGLSCPTLTAQLTDTRPYSRYALGELVARRHEV